MFGSEQGRQVNAGRLGQEFAEVPEPAIDRRGMADQADTQAAQRRETLID
jgi:hypothetical protein